MVARRRTHASRPLVFGSAPVAAAPAVPPTAIEWSPHPCGQVGWSYSSRRIYAKPADGRPQRDFELRADALAYLEGRDG